MEREYLTGDWTTAKILLALLVPISFAALGLVFWKRSIVYGLVLINAIVLIKLAWSFYFGDESGGLTLLPSALAGLAVCDAVVLYVLRRRRKRSLSDRRSRRDSMAARHVDGSSRTTTTDGIGGTNVTAKKPATETGTFLGEFPYVRLGDGPENLVILPGLTLENEPASRLDVWTYRLGFGRFAEGHTVYVIKRRRNMPQGYTTRDLAADYARVMEEELGPSRVMGFSTGGSIAQYVALDHPELVERLILVVTASRLSEEGRATCERWRRLAHARRWRELRADMASVNVTGEANKRLAGAFMKVFGRFVLGEPSDPSDFLTTLEADLGHDTTARLPESNLADPRNRRERRPVLPGEPPARDRREDTGRAAAGVRGRWSRRPQRAQEPVRG